jgi:polyferredoxin
MNAAFWADVIVGVHVAYVAFVVLVVPAVLVGGLQGACWVRNSWFRNIHLAMIAVVVVQSVCGVTCPLTVWENRLRALAGEQGYERSFIGHWLHDLLFFDLSPGAFAIIYTVFGLLVVGLYLVFPPRWLSRRKTE